jgi:hypothetical protein
LYYREHLDELPKPEEKPKRTRRKKEEKPVTCEIEDVPEDHYLSQ